MPVSPSRTVVTISMRTEARGACDAYEDLIGICDSLACAREYLRANRHGEAPAPDAWTRVPPVGRDERERYALTVAGGRYIVSVWSVSQATAD